MQMNKKLKKVLAIILIFVMTFADMAFIGKSAFVYAADVILENQNSKTANSNVEFDAYFLKENNNKVYSIVKDVNDEDVSINLALNVKNAGYLKDAKIQFKSTDEKNVLNYKIKEDIQADEIIQSFENNTLKLKLINNMTEEQLIKIPIEYYSEEYISLDKISKESKIILTGTYIDVKGKETNIEKELIINMGWKDEKDITVESNIEKYIPYNVEGKSGVILQTVLKVSSEKRKNMLPIKETVIDIDVPKIDGVEVSKVQVVAKNTTATNGKSNELVTFDSSNWKYDSENKKINIKVQGTENENKAYYSGEGTDEFIITYTYSEDAYSKIAEQSINLTPSITVNVTRYSAESNTNISKSVNANYNISKKMGDLVSYDIENYITEITKGYMYANYNKENGLYETQFNTKAIINISYKDMVEEILLRDVNQYFIDKDGNRYNSDDLYYKEISFNKENILQILGKDGKIQIVDNNNVILHEITNIENIVADTNGNYIIKFDNKIKSILIKTTKPEMEGNLNINFVKVIEKVSYDKETSKNFTKVVSQTELLSKYTYVDEYVNISEIQTETDLLETVTDSKLYINKNSLSTLVANDNVEMRIELNNSKAESDIYGDSTFEIVLPKYIENIEISDAKLIYGEGLKIDKAELVRQGENLVIKVSLVGKQESIVTNTNLTDGSNILTNGTNIVFNTSMKINMLTPSMQDEIKLYYTNSDYTNYKTVEEGRGYYSEKIEYNAPTGLVAINGTKNYNEENKTIYSINNGKVEDIIEILADARIATMEMLIMNNNMNTVTDINILGRFPFKGNKSVIKNENLNTTLDTTLKTPITSNNANAIEAIYYSDNENASKDLTDINNGWTTDLAKLQNVKSYLIVLNKDYAMQPSEVLKFEYQYEIPENLQHSNNFASNFAVYYTNNTDVATLAEIQESEVIGLTTGEGPVLDLKLQSDVNSQKVKEYQEIVYTTKVKNDGDLPAKDVVVSIDTPSYTQLKSYSIEDNKIVPQYSADENKMQFRIDEISAGESKEMKIYVDVDKIPTVEQYYSSDERFSITDDGKYCLLIEKENAEDPENPIIEEQIIESLDGMPIKAVATLTARDLAKELISEEVSNIVEEAEFSIEESTEDSGLILKENKEVEFDIIINNLTSETKNNVVVKSSIPEGLIFKEAYMVDENGEMGEPSKINIAQYDESSREITWNIETVEGNDSKQLKLIVITDKLKEGITKTTLYSNSVVYADSTESYKSNTVETNIGRASLIVSQTTDRENTYVKEGDVIKYFFTIKNEGTVDADNVEFIDTIPDGLKVSSIEYTSNGSTSSRTLSGTDSATFNTSIAPNETINVTVTVIATSLRGTAEKSTTNYGVVKFDGQDIKTNSITHIIENNSNAQYGELEKSETSGNSTNNNNNINTNLSSRTYKLSGTAWLDANENGMRDSNESKISGIAVKLVNSNTNSIEKETTTNGSGDYTFTGLSLGNYFIVFEYDTLKYGLTEYRKAEIATNVNSDVIATKIEQDGKVKNAAVTDIIALDSVSMSNIDIGLVNAQKFDLSLNKAISKITVQTREGTKTTTFDNSKIAKPEISAKYMSGSTVLVEYVISISNEGDIAGTARKIIDYLPEGMTFNSNLNPNWYSGSDGNIYTSELENTIIEPGETAEVKVVLTKAMTDENAGLINNQAEIYEDYNVYGITDRDSITANKAQGEDDISYADVIITVRTGETLIYISVIIISLIVLGTGIFLIRMQFSKKRKEV